MSSQMKHEWVRVISVQGCDSRLKFEILLEFLGDWRQRIEYMEASINSNPFDFTTFINIKELSC